jgi:5-methyltetrahydrofolate--homocysteine methyltransferase
MRTITKELFKNTPLFQALSESILVLDGAMGTQIQSYELEESDFKGQQLKDHTNTLKGNNDILCLTQPTIIKEIYDTYLQAGTDIITTNTFNATKISQADYGTDHLVYDINYEGAKIAREKADEWTKRTPNKPRFVVGSLGPTKKMGSLSPNINDPSYRTASFDDFRDNYEEQILGLLEGGADLLIIETITDLLNVRAALVAADKVFQKKDKALPIMISATLIDTSGRILSGHGLDAFLAAVKSDYVISLGLNCSFGAKDLIPYIEKLSENQDLFISVHPNAGMPDEEGHYGELPEDTAKLLETLIKHQQVNILGGCCGTTPKHIEKIAQGIKGHKPRPIPLLPDNISLAGTEMVSLNKGTPLLSVADALASSISDDYIEALDDEDYDSVIDELKDLLEDNYDLLKINLDSLDNTQDVMNHLLKYMASEPSISKYPLVIESSNWPVIETALKAIQGRFIINYLGTETDETLIKEHHDFINNYGSLCPIDESRPNTDIESNSHPIKMMNLKHADEVFLDQHPLLKKAKENGKELIIYDPRYV